MTDVFKLDIKGMDEIRKRIDRLPQRLQNNVYRASNMAGARYLRDQIKAAAPKRSGKLVKAIKARSRRSPKGEFWSAVHITGDGFYWRFYEFGVAVRYRKNIRTVFGLRRTVSGRFTTGTMGRRKAFVRPTLDQHEQQAIRIVFESMRPQLQRVLSKNYGG